MNRLKIYCLILFLFLSFSVPALSYTQPDNMVLTIGDTLVRAGDYMYEIAVAPAIYNDVTMIPLRFVVEILGAKVGWDNIEKRITVMTAEKEIYLKPGNNEVLVNGVAQIIAVPPKIENDTSLVPLRFLAENMNYQVTFIPGTKEIHISEPPPPNQSPVAEFFIEKDVVAQGETIIYTDNSYDPDGDKLVETKWTGRERTFFAPGEYKVTLEVKDSKGNWSAPFIKIITVTEEVLMDRLTYNFTYPIPGENVGNIPGLSVLDLEKINPTVSLERLNLYISNSPEIVRDNGIIYSEKFVGENRLYYHHINGSDKNKRIYPVVINQGTEPVFLTVKKWAIAGPDEAMAVGRTAVYRYLDFQSINKRFIELPPGEKLILYQGITRAMKPGEAVNGIFDVSASDELLFSVVVVEDQDPVANYKQLPMLVSNDTHVRGIFPVTERALSVKLDGKKSVRLVLGDGIENEQLDMYSQLFKGNNPGNYGVLYRIAVNTKQRVGILFSPRGGVFAGAAKWQGEVFNLPNNGVARPKSEYVSIGVVEPGRERVLEFIPPAGSYMPVNIIFYQF